MFMEAKNGNISTLTDGSIAFKPNLWTYGPATPESIADALTQKDVETILNACGGDFSRIDPATAKGMALFAAVSLEKREEQKKKRAARRARKAAEFHKMIMTEIHELMGDNEFTPAGIQLVAQGKGYPVRTRQMYIHHLIRAARGDDKKIIERYYRPACGITVILRNGKTSSQNIPGTDGYYWRFITEERG